MNLSLYVLLASENEFETRVTSLAPCLSTESAVVTGHRVKPIYDPHRPSGKGLLQASYRPTSANPAPHKISRSLGFGVAVLANTLGFLVMTSGLMLMLQIAQAALR